MIARVMFYLLPLRRNLRLEPYRLKELQLRKLRAIITHAYENVPFYHRKFEEVGIKPHDVNSLADLSKVPMTTKSEIQARPLEDIVARNVDVTKCVKRTTSGSTGLPLTIVVEKRAKDFDTAVWYRFLSEIGLKLWDKMAYIADPRSFPKSKRWYKRLGINRRENISIFERVEKQLALLEKFKPEVVKGYTSSLKILADFCKHSSALAFKPRFVITGAELLDGETRRLINTVFEAEVLDIYSCNEFGLLAWECPEHTGYHMNLDNVLMEFVKNGETTAHGERGEIVCTTLVNQAMPLIRYRIGDVGVPIKEECSCGRKLPLMKVVEGRLDDFLLALDGRTISPSIFFPYPFENLEGIKQFRVIQEKRDKLTIQLAVADNFLIQGQFLEKARRKIQNLFGEKMQVEFEIKEKLYNDPTGKLRKTISKIHPSL